MEFTFVSTKEFEDFKSLIKEYYMALKRNGAKIIIDNLLCYVIICSIIIML